MSDSPPAEIRSGPFARRKFTGCCVVRGWLRFTRCPSMGVCHTTNFWLARRILMSADHSTYGFALLSAPGDGSVTLGKGTPGASRTCWALDRRRSSCGYARSWGRLPGEMGKRGAEATNRAVLGDKNWEVVERIRERDAKKTGGSSNETNVLDYMYLSNSSTFWWPTMSGSVQAGLQGEATARWP